MRRLRDLRARCETSLAWPLSRLLFHLLYHRFQFVGDGRESMLLDKHFVMHAALDDDVVLAPLGVLVRKVFAELSAAAFFAEKSRMRDGLGDDEHAAEVHCGVPSIVVLAIAADAGAVCARFKLCDFVERLLHFT